MYIFKISFTEYIPGQSQIAIALHFPSLNQTWEPTPWAQIQKAFSTECYLQQWAAP